MTHLVVLAAFTALGCALGWCAAHLAGPHHAGDRPVRPGTNRLLHGGGGSGPDHLFSLGGMVGGPTPPAPTSAPTGEARRAPRGWNLAPTHPAAPRPQLYNWADDEDGVA